MSENSESEKDYDEASLKPIPVPGKIYPPIKNSELVIGRNIARTAESSMQVISKETRKTSVPINLYND